MSLKHPQARYCTSSSSFSELPFAQTRHSGVSSAPLFFILLLQSEYKTCWFFFHNVLTFFYFLSCPISGFHTGLCGWTTLSLGGVVSSVAFRAPSFLPHPPLGWPPSFSSWFPGALGVHHLLLLQPVSCRLCSAVCWGSVSCDPCNHLTFNLRVSAHAVPLPRRLPTSLTFPNCLGAHSSSLLSEDVPDYPLNLTCLGAPIMECIVICYCELFSDGFTWDNHVSQLAWESFKMQGGSSTRPCPSPLAHTVWRLEAVVLAFLPHSRYQAKRPPGLFTGSLSPSFSPLPLFSVLLRFGSHRGLLWQVPVLRPGALP